jgi:murein DD-endopeptidase MepM/ murein hydrolase activator NlpD
MRAFLSAALALLALASCRLPWSGGGDAACADGARLGFPVDLSAFADSGTVWPHGVHGAGHPEGHPGIDFTLDRGTGDVTVTSPLSAEIVAVQAESTAAGNSCIVLDSACVQVNLCHLRLDPGLKQGDSVRRGQRLGTVGKGEGAGSLSLHFGVYMGPEAEQVCPAEFLDADTLRCRVGLDAGDAAPSNCGALSGSQTMLGRSNYTESYARSMTVTCADGGKEVFAMPAETRLCNPRLDEEARARMQKCLGPSCAGIW